MTDDKVSFPSIEEKEQYVLMELTCLMEDLRISDLQVNELNKIHLSFRCPNVLDKNELFHILEDRGYKKEESRHTAMFHKYDDKTAVASNVSYDKEKNLSVIAINY